MARVEVRIEPARRPKPGGFLPKDVRSAGEASAGVRTAKAQAFVPADSSAVVPSPTAEPPAKIEIEVDGLVGLTDKGLRKLQERAQLFTDDVVREASRFEEGERAETAVEVPEITATMIDDAYRVVRRTRELIKPPVKPNRQKQAVQIVAALSGVAWGAMLTLLHSAWQAGLCVGLGITFAATTFWLVWGGHE